MGSLAVVRLDARIAAQTLLVLSSLPLAVAGSICLLAFMHYNLSTAVWVGLIAVAGVAAETGIVMVAYLDEAFERYTREGRIQTPEDVDAAVVEGARARVRSLLMTVATTRARSVAAVVGSRGGRRRLGADGGTVVGGLWSCMFLTPLVLPAAYAMWRRHQVRASLAVSLPHDAAATTSAGAPDSPEVPRAHVPEPAPWFSASPFLPTFGGAV